MASGKINFRPIDSFFGNFTDEALLKYRSCPLCGSKDFDVISKIDNFQFFSDSRELPKRCLIQNVICQDCLCVYMNPAYTNYGFNILFSQSSMSYGAPGGSREKIAPWLIQHEIIKFGDCILDIGCGDGSFLNTFPRDTVCIGIDIDKPSVDRAHKLFPHIKFVNNSFENISIEQIPNVITLIHVLEHLPNPVATLRALRDISSEETFLVVEVPVLECATGGDVTGFFTMIHMQHFSRSILRSMLEKSGWKIIKTVQMDGYNGYRVIAKKGQPNLAVMPCPADKEALQSLMSQEAAAIDALEERICSILCSNKAGDKLVIWGAGMHTETLYHKTSLFDSSRKLDYALIDIDPAKQGRSWRGISCYAPEGVLSSGDKHKIIISSYGNTPEILKMARSLSPSSSIEVLYDTIITR